jgi:hypothetical protein
MIEKEPIKKSFIDMIKKFVMTRIFKNNCDISFIFSPVIGLSNGMPTRFKTVINSRIFPGQS